MDIDQINRTLRTMMTSNNMPMPKEIQEIHDALWQQVPWLHAKWDIFLRLYGTDSATIDLLNRTAPTFFAVCQKSLMNEILLTISRITDPARSAGKDTLSLGRIVKCIDPTRHPELAANIQRAYINLGKQCTAIRELRNRSLAHNDLLTLTKTHQEPLPDITLQHIEIALKGIRDIMNMVEEYFQETTTYFETPPLPGGADSLLICLRDAETYRQQEKARRHRV